MAGSLPGILHLLMLYASWVLLLCGVSSIYTITVQRFDHSDWWSYRRRLIMEDRSRRRL